jgi:hypothetical protein
MAAGGDVSEEPPDAVGDGPPERTGVVVIRVWLESAYPTAWFDLAVVEHHAAGLRPPRWPRR